MASILPPQRISVKRRRDEEPLSTLYIETAAGHSSGTETEIGLGGTTTEPGAARSKRRFTDFVFRRLHVDDGDDGHKHTREEREEKEERQTLTQRERAVRRRRRSQSRGRSRGFVGVGVKSADMRKGNAEQKIEKSFHTQSGSSDGGRDGNWTSKFVSVLGDVDDASVVGVQRHRSGFTDSGIPTVRSTRAEDQEVIEDKGSYGEGKGLKTSDIATPRMHGLGNENAASSTSEIVPESTIQPSRSYIGQQGQASVIPRANTSLSPTKRRQLSRSDRRSRSRAASPTKGPCPMNHLKGIRRFHLSKSATGLPRAGTPSMQGRVEKSKRKFVPKIPAAMFVESRSNKGRVQHLHSHGSATSILESEFAVTKDQVGSAVRQDAVELDENSDTAMDVEPLAVQQKKPRLQKKPNVNKVESLRRRERIASSCLAKDDAESYGTLTPDGHLPRKDSEDEAILSQLEAFTLEVIAETNASTTVTRSSTAKADDRPTLVPAYPSVPSRLERDERSRWHRDMMSTSSISSFASDDEDDYIIETYERVPISQIQSATRDMWSKAADVHATGFGGRLDIGIIELSIEDSEWIERLEHEQHDEEDEEAQWGEDEDSNAEDHFANDYPDEEEEYADADGNTSTDEDEATGIRYGYGLQNGSDDDEDDEEDYGYLYEYARGALHADANDDHDVDDYNEDEDDLDIRWNGEFGSRTRWRGLSATVDADDRDAEDHDHDEVNDDEKMDRYNR